MNDTINGYVDEYYERFQELLAEILKEHFDNKTITPEWFDAFVEVKNVAPEEDRVPFSCLDRPAQRLRQRELEAGDTTALDNFLKEFY